MSAWFVDQFIEAGEADLVLDFTTPVPAVLTLEMMGMPAENWRHYADFFHATSSFERHEPEYQEAVSRLGGDVGGAVGVRQEPAC